ncbi:MAG: glycoside hydrolase family 3 C-terminal domain-containing protein [Chthoniobacteraceae bacterium]
MLIPPGLDAAAAESGAVYQNPAAPVEARVEDLLGRLTLDEKIAMLSGSTYMSLRVNPRLGIPEILMSDGPEGVRCYGPSTAYAGGLALAASWDVDLAQRVGTAIGRDARARGVHILLAPGMNLYRAPMDGRNFEFFGEDPLLSGTMAVEYIQGVQSQGVAATAKHLICNEQEFDRHHISSNVDERTLRELYLKPFAMCVKGGVWCVMNSYNPLNGIHATQDGWLNNTILKGELGFRGLLMSDWKSCYNTLGIANGGLDLEMPSGDHFNPAMLLPLLDGGKVAQATIDDKVRRQLRVAFSMGWFDRPQLDGSIPKDDPRSAAIALEGAREAIVLLKNDDHLLPLDRSKVKKLVVLGPNAEPAMTGAGGSSFVTPFHAVSLLDGLTQIAGPGIEIVYVPWTGPSISDKDATKIKSADAAIICAGFKHLSSDSPGPPDPAFEGEGADRNYALPPGQPELIRAVAKLNPRLIVILNAGGSVATADWIDNVPAFVDSFYPGQAGGTALAEILFGDVNPSGKLPFSWEKRWEDCAAYGDYPTAESGRVNDYKEGVFLGYRWFDEKGIAPLFPFGEGLSYTTFDFSDFKTSIADGNLSATVTVRNTGARTGAEVVQVYVQPPAGPAPRPPRELKGFARVELQPGESRTVTIPCDALSYWNPRTKTWTTSRGDYIATLGNSSRQLYLSSKFGL